MASNGEAGGLCESYHSSTDDHQPSVPRVLDWVPIHLLNPCADTTPRPQTCSPTCRVSPCIPGPSSLAYILNSPPSTHRSAPASMYTSSSGTWPGREHAPQSRKVTKVLVEYPRVDRFGRIDKGKGRMQWDEGWVSGGPFGVELVTARKMEGPHMMNHTSVGKRWSHDVADKMRQDYRNTSGPTTRASSMNPDGRERRAITAATASLKSEPQPQPQPSLSSAGEQMQRKHMMELEEEEHQKRKKARIKKIKSACTRAIRGILRR
ncbi:hypothetical protein BKA58DRAFT_421011 [Alternaria rosae]|uniref:uncharacterized protein n=1 Tax=Alternaria rosae TaxID=1187941 RepID=UPI001E8DF23C|nr:uncharacterized protein BKA58DRAFT_421011 [Alternaria rosae]KAH6870475.1 hypothetical protein BKA58DRAFT_421011 [Alternaria rosae]